MAIRIALLRGVNVGGNNRMKMAELAKLCESLGLKGVQTYIQSGNILFSSDEPEDVLRDRLHRGIADRFGFSASAVLRSAQEWRAMIASCPFDAQKVAELEASSEFEVQHVALLRTAPEPGAVEALRAYQAEGEEMAVVGRDIHLLTPQSIRNSKLAGRLSKLDEAVTVRNWKTVEKIAEMAKGMGD